MIRRRYRAWCAPILLLAGAAQGAVRVEITGLEGEERGNVEARLAIRQQAQREDLDQALVERLHEQAAANIREALQPYGYYSPEIQAELEGSGPEWVARYRIDAGPPTRISAVDLQLVGEGAQYDGFERARRRLERRLKPEMRLRHADYAEVKAAFTDAAYAGGYLDAHWKQNQIRVNPDARQAEIVLHLDTGPRYYFGAVTLEQEGLDPAFIGRYVTLQQGDPFDPQEVLDQQFALGDLGYFQSVEIEPKRDQTGDDHRVPLVIHTSPRNRSRYEAGLGYGTDTGARVSAGLERRRINRHGHNFDGDLRLSEIKNSMVGNYRIPLGRKPGENVTLTALTESEILEDGETAKWSIGAGLNRNPGDWQRRVYVEFLHEESELGDEVATADLFTPGVSFTRTEADDPIYARQGWYLFADLHGAAHNLLSSTSFVRSYVQLRGVYSLDWRTRLLGRVEVGANFAEQFGELPASQRFFAGGDQSVRGYAYESIGTRDENDDVIGGAYLTTYSIEAERRVWKNWGAAVFADAGGAGEEPTPTLYYGVGVGVRYRAPIGSLQLDLAHPLDEDENPVRVHIGVRVGL